MKNPNSIQFKMLDALKIAEKYLGKMVADGKTETTIPPEMVLRYVSGVIEQTEKYYTKATKAETKALPNSANDY